MSAEEIETALIKANDDLALIHTSLLKGIPPVSKHLMHSDAWVAELCKTVAPWWPWVAEGENPLEVEKGEERMRYKVLDPTTRLLILKALCEVRAFQDDISRYITDVMKNGTSITAFRKERIGDEVAGITYWYDGDQVLGYRLYKEIVEAETNQENKEKGCLAQRMPDSSWETLATNLKEFKEISDNLMSSKCSTEAAIVEIAKTEIIPVLEKLEKKKRQAIKGRGLKRKTLNQKRRLTLFLDDFHNSSGTGTRRSQRLQKHVKYIFDDSDRKFEEALRTPKKIKTNGSVKNSNTKVQKRVGSWDSDKEKHIQEGSTEKDSHQFTISGDDTDKTDDVRGDSNDEVRAIDVKSRVMGGRACFDNGNDFDAEGMKKRPRATPPADVSVIVISDSDNESLKDQTFIVLDNEGNVGESSTSGSWGRMSEQDNEGESFTSGSLIDEQDSSDGGSSDDEE